MALFHEGPPTPDGGRVLVHQQQALNYSTLASLEEHGTAKKEVELITCACLQILNRVPTSPTELELIPGWHTSGVQSMKVLIKAHRIIMSLVLYAMCLLGQQWP